MDADLAGDIAMAVCDAPVRAGLEQLRHRATDGIGMRASAREIAANWQVDPARDFVLQRRGDGIYRRADGSDRETDAPRVALRIGMARVPKDLANRLSACLLARSAQPGVESNQRRFGNPTSDSSQEQPALVRAAEWWLLRLRSESPRCIPLRAAHFG